MLWGLPATLLKFAILRWIAAAASYYLELRLRENLGKDDGLIVSRDGLQEKDMSKSIVAFHGF